MMARNLCSSFQLTADVEHVVPLVLFSALSEEWKRETMHLSSSTMIVEHPAYQAVVGLGESAIPLILADLERKGPSLWVIALHELTGENPLEPRMIGDVERITEAWLEWGIENGWRHSSRTSEIGSSRARWTSATTASRSRPAGLLSVGMSTSFSTGLKAQKEAMTSARSRVALRLSDSRFAPMDHWSEDSLSWLYTVRKGVGRMLLDRPYMAHGRAS